MSKEALAKVVQRSISDAAFRRQLATDPAGALRGYDLSQDERSALRSGDSARLTAFGVDQRMSKAFTIGDPGNFGSANINSAQTDLGAGSAGSNVNSALTGAASAQATGADTMSGGAGSTSVIPSDPARADSIVAGGGEPRDTAPTWIGEYQANLGTVQNPDAADRNAALTGADSYGGVQSPDAAERNAAITGADSYGGVQSPDAADRNLAAMAGGSAEPRDVAPTWIGDNQSLSSVMPDEGHQVMGTATFDAGTQDDALVPSIGHAAELAVDTDGGASSGTDTHEGPEIQP